MDKIIVQGKQHSIMVRLSLKVLENAVLPLLAATILPEGQINLNEYTPILSDVYTMNNVVRGLDIAVGL